jgi:hypothetical protein
MIPSDWKKMNQETGRKAKIPLIGKESRINNPLHRLTVWISFLLEIERLLPTSKGKPANLLWLGKDACEAVCRRDKRPRRCGGGKTDTPDDLVDPEFRRSPENELFVWGNKRPQRPTNFKQNQQRTMQSNERHEQEVRDGSKQSL